MPLRDSSVPPAEWDLDPTGIGDIAELADELRELGLERVLDEFGAKGGSRRDVCSLTFSGFPRSTTLDLMNFGVQRLQAMLTS